ncbi:hypothetical protein CWI38_1679p0030 [Hamiltosporidium tvaerminnensis]|uniref:Uncharacterized protein n=1 Tax=Hamiltosporidium tvaerminnensis TaxID=1176355 RepID=A0A4Q9LSN5_9MICR|nr:hypothetical protein CWI38_1679p0030 [Hamiltosporidium tvaerminnensis]
MQLSLVTFKISKQFHPFFLFYSLLGTLLLFLPLTPFISFLIVNTLLLVSTLIDNTPLLYLTYGYTLSLTYLTVTNLSITTLRKENINLLTRIETITILMSLILPYNNKTIFIVYIFIQFLNIKNLTFPPVISYHNTVAIERLYITLCMLYGRNSYNLITEEYKTVLDFYYNRKQEIPFNVTLSFFYLLTPLLLINTSSIVKYAVTFNILVNLQLFELASYCCYLMCILRCYLFAALFGLLGRVSGLFYVYENNVVINNKRSSREVVKDCSDIIKNCQKTSIDKSEINKIQTNNEYLSNKIQTKNKYILNKIQTNNEYLSNKIQTKNKYILNKIQGSNEYILNVNIPTRNKLMSSIY